MLQPESLRKGFLSGLRRLVILDSMASRRAFTVEEADALIPLLEALLDQIEEQKRRLARHGEKLQILEVLWGQQVTAPDNPDHREFLQHHQARNRLIQEIDQLVRREIRGRGLRFPAGGLTYGLIDFPTTFEGRWVYLCWQRGEARVGFWHELGAGYAGRQEIAAEHVIAMGKEDDPEALDDSGLDF